MDISLSADDLGVSALLADSECGSADNVFAFFNDEGDFGAGTACIAPIALEGNMIPVQALSAFDGQQSAGDWTLTVTDSVGGDNGTLNEWCVYMTLE